MEGAEALTFARRPPPPSPPPTTTSLSPPLARFLCLCLPPPPPPVCETLAVGLAPCSPGVEVEGVEEVGGGFPPRRFPPRREGPVVPASFEAVVVVEAEAREESVMRYGYAIEGGRKSGGGGERGGIVVGREKER